MLGSAAELIIRAITGNWLLLVIGVLLLLYIIGTWNYNFFDRRGLPSTRPRVPFAGDFLWTFLGFRAFSEFTKELYEKGKGHGVFGVFELLRPMYIIRDPELVKVVGVKEFDNFINHRSLAIDKTDPILSKNLFNLKDHAWRDMRATLSPAFTTSKIKVMVPLISQCAEQLSLHLSDKYKKSQEGISQQPLFFDMKDTFTRLTNDVIAITAFGVSCDSLKFPNNEFYLRGKKMTTFNALRSLLAFAIISIPKLIEKTGLRLLDGESTAFFDSLVHDTIREREKRGIFRPDVLQLLMQAREGKLKAEKEDAAEAEDVGASAKKLSDDDISAQALIFFFGGFETVATALCLATSVLSHHPDVQKRLQEEIDDALEKTERKLTYESIQSMKYLDAVINEVLRLYPPSPFTERQCVKTTILPAGAESKPATIEKGTIIQIPIIGLHTDPKYWDDPDKFDPERFSDQNKHKIKPFTYNPFGVGPRICIGQRFALIEVKMALVHLLSDFDLHPCDKTKYPLEFKPGANLISKGGFWCGITPRIH